MYVSCFNYKKINKTVIVSAWVKKKKIRVDLYHAVKIIHSRDIFCNLKALSAYLYCVCLSECVSEEYKKRKREGPPWVIRPSVQPTVNLEPENRSIESGKWVAGTKSVCIGSWECVCSLTLKGNGKSDQLYHSG